MKRIRLELLIDVGGFSSSNDWKRIKEHIEQGIYSIEWPPGSGKFILHDQSGKKRGEGSGVVPIKEAFMASLKSYGWSLEMRVNIASIKRPGPIDATYHVGKKLFAVEWETGNISSSHRAMNKMAFGIQKGILIGGILILTTRKMYRYLTDRVGNFEELEPYFPLWKSLSITIEEGLLGILAIEHDAVSINVPRIPKGTNGRALQ